MRVPRVYTTAPLAPNSAITLDPGASHHLLKVLRMHVDRELIVFSGDGYEYPATIRQADKKLALIQTSDKVHRPNTSSLNSEIAIGLSKGDRLDWVVQKATELGVSTIYPLFTARSEVKLNKERAEKKRNSWAQIAISACEQCQRNTIPTIHSPMSLNEFLRTSDAEAKFVLHHRTHEKLSRSKPPKSVSFLIGPEGGLSEEEIHTATTEGFLPLSFGQRVLRTETAPITALSIAQHLWGDLQ